MQTLLPQPALRLSDTRERGISAQTLTPLPHGGTLLPLPVRRTPAKQSPGTATLAGNHAREQSASSPRAHACVGAIPLRPVTPVGEKRKVLWNTGHVRSSDAMTRRKDHHAMKTTNQSCEQGCQFGRTRVIVGQSPLLTHRNGNAGMPAKITVFVYQHSLTP
ncbi:hypothetical protein UY3_05719 [Chelonia mydas]|uniref:Uncharacterized protein n=1 Tax=Chelonia mydas TaxID=8469 RepID=M7BYM3_CHEMY|nr:hypothetical protein UY3_05719 [Chelonia mydas]